MTTELVEAFRKLQRDQPARPLLYLPASGTIVTAMALGDAAAAINAALTSACVSPGAVLVSAIGNRLGSLALFAACRERGAALLPLDGAATPGEIGAIAAQFGAAAILLATAQPVPGFSRISTIASSLTLAVADVNPGDSRHGSAAVLKMTSGSTGAPRATLTLEAALVSDSRALMTAMDIRAHDVQIAAIPLSHSYGLGSLVGPLFLQGTAIVMREAFVPQRLPEDARAHGARFFPGVPFMFEHLVKNQVPGGWPPTLTRLITAGAPIEPKVVERFHALYGVKIHSFYGTSETGGIAYDAGDAPTTASADAAGVDGRAVGTALPGVTLTLVAHDAAPAGAGRLHVRGPAVVSGYADGIDQESFTDGGFLTGDLGSLDNDGQLWLTGRVSALVNIAGRKVHPDEVERVLRMLDGCADVRVIGLADPRRGEQLVACLVMTGARPSLVSLRQFCGARMASYKIPRAFVFLDAIPLTARGKTDRRRLEADVEALLQTSADML